MDSLIDLAGCAACRTRSVSFEVAQFGDDEHHAREEAEQLKPEAQAKELSNVGPSVSLLAPCVGTGCLGKGLMMARTPRMFVLDEEAGGLYHCINRCVRRAFLCGADQVSSD